MADEPAFHRLTDKHKACLRLVARLYGSKEIAQELGISPHTVDARLRATIQILNARDRFDAATMFLARESTYQPLIYQNLELPEPRRSGFAEPAPESGASPEASDRPNVVREERAFFEGHVPGDQNLFRRMLPERKGTSNDLSIIERLMRIAVLTALFALAFGTLLGSMANTTTVLRSIFSSSVTSPSR